MSVVVAANRPPSQQADDNDTLIPSLPADIAINILARIPRSQHPILSLVSNPFKSLLASPRFFSMRRLVGISEPCLYLTLRCHSSNSLLFFTLQCKPLKRRFIPVAPIPSPHSKGSAYATLGTDLYVLGGSVNGVGSSCVWILDCRFNTWSSGPTMRVGRNSAAAAAINSSLYVMGGCEPDTLDHAANWTEVLDPAGNGSWAPVSSPKDVRQKWMLSSAVMDGKMYAMGDRGFLIFDPLTREWESAGGELDMGWKGGACVVNEVLYCYDYMGMIKWFDGKKGFWKELKGVQHRFPRFLCEATLANMGGNLVVVWVVTDKENERKMEVWGAEIKVKKHRNGNMFGVIQWYDLLLKAHSGSIENCVAVAL